jgi:regulatory protein
MAEERDEQTKQALITSLRLLAASPKSRQELKAKLESKGYSAKAIQNALRELSEQGVLDDKAFAKNLIGRLVHGKGSGRYKIAFELKLHGISEPVRKDLLGELTESSEKERALELAKLKWTQFSKLDPQKRKKKLFDHLLRKGYDFQTAHEVLDELLKGDAGGGFD